MHDLSTTLFADLTQAQADAVRHTEGPLLVLAGPGSGKTRVITRRIAYLVNCGIPPWQILALTFTNKAAGEMRERTAHLLGDGNAVRGLTVTTFHALCARLLRRFADQSGIPGLGADFTIYDDSDQLALIKKAIDTLDISTSNFPPRAQLSRISAAKNELKDPDAFAREAFDFQSRMVAKVYAEYQRGLRQANAADFDDLLLHTATMLREVPAIRDACRDRWRYLLIDEYQDTNRAQFIIASLLAGETDAARPAGPNICVVGDPDQSIYGWRGADISNILDFESVYPGARVIPLGENFRSTASIVAVADALIRRNRKRKHKDLFTSRHKGEKVEAVACRDEHHEASLVTDWIRELRHEALSSDAPLQYKDFAILYRTNALSRVMEDQLRSSGIPYTIARGTAFYQREEVKNALAYVRLAANPADDVSLARIINTPTRGIGDTTFAKVELAATARAVPVYAMLREIAASPQSAGVELSSRAQNSIAKFVEMVDAWTGAGSFMGSTVSGTLRELVGRIVAESGLETMYRAARTEADADRVDNLAELVSSAADFEIGYAPEQDAALDPPTTDSGPAEPPLLSLLRAYLERVALVADADAVDPASGAVTLLTLHAAKGLEFRAAALIGLEEGCLPHIRSQESDAALEEERRLCFVGITRAMERLLLTCSRYRTIRGLSERTIPSRFLSELSPQHVAFSDQSEDARAGEWDSPASTRPRPPTERDPLPAGSTVRHPQFGVGTVISVTRGENARATIKFRDAGTKTLVLEYARLQVLG